MAEAAAVQGKTFFGHPRGLSTLFFTEMWERFSYYGMRALLILFMTDTAHHGLGMNPERAGAIYGLYTFGVYALALPGGWIADRLVGQRKAVLYGGVLIALGHYALAVPSVATFYLGLVLIVLGTGLLKPNVSAIVGDLYTETGARRDAGFSIFYMGINLGAFFGPLLCSLVVGAGELKDDFAQPEMIAGARRSFANGIGALTLLIVGIVGLSSAGILPVTLVGFAKATGGIVVVLAAIYFAVIIAFVCRDGTERRRVGLCAVLFVGAAMFWSGFEQAGSSMNLFARDFTDRTLGVNLPFIGNELTAGMLQSVNPIFIILLAPVIGMLWVWLGSRNPSIPLKFGVGLALLGTGFFVMSWGASFVDEGKVGMQWLVATYFLHTVGGLCLSPVGLSSVTKLAPDRLVGQMMGTWFMGAALGNLVAGLVAGFIESMTQTQLYSTVATIVLVTGIVYVVLAKPLNWLAAGMK
jgi:POT family proton-dependent oligopeptide transporter